METPLYRARMTVPRERLDDLMDALAVLEPAPNSWEDVDTGEAWVETFDVDREVVAVRAREMAAVADAFDGRVHAAVIEKLEHADWAEAWKRFFHVARVSPRIVVRPSWEPFDAAPDDIVVDIDPGLSFGTGLHPTTQACLRCLDGLAADPAGPKARSVVDLGCGSGILAIAAAKLGFAPITALDYDPQAIRVTLENIALNGLTPEHIACSVGDVLLDPLPEGDIVVANILAGVLIEAAPRITAAVRQSPDAALILSGILDVQYEEVRAAYAAMGFRQMQSWLDGDWRSGCFRREGARL